jgi:hypothetical protein
MAVQMQDHIHLDTVIGGAPENAPTLTWKATQRQKVTSLMTKFERGLTGKAFFNVKTGPSGPLRFVDWTYMLKVTESELATLEGLVGKVVSLVDHLHPDDGEDHDAHIETMGFVKIGEPRMANVKGVYYEVSIYLADMHTEE